MQINNKQKDDLDYLCYVIESLGRKTKNRRKTIIEAIVLKLI